MADSTIIHASVHLPEPDESALAFRCELCGQPADARPVVRDRPLKIDYVIHWAWEFLCPACRRKRLENRTKGAGI